jgi:hypothetical protein
LSEILIFAKRKNHNENAPPGAALTPLALVVDLTSPMINPS